MRKKYIVKRTGAVLLAAALTATSITVPQRDTATYVKAADEESGSTILKQWNFATGLDGWSYGTGWEYEYSGADNSSVSYDDGKMKATVDFSQDADQSWSQMALSLWNNSAMDFVGANQITFDFYYDSSAMTQGTFMFKLFSNDAGIDETVSLNTADAEVVDGTIMKVPVTVDMDEITSEDAEATHDLAICLVGNQTDYKGDVWFDSIKVTSETKEVVENDVTKSWTFDSSADGWYYGSGWEYQYTGASNSSVGYEDGKLKINVDYSNDSASSWAQCAACVWENTAMDLTGCNAASLDFYFDKSVYNTGSFKLKLYSNGGIESTADVDFADGEEVEGTDLIKVPVSFVFEPLEDASSVNDLSVCIVGVNTDYTGALYLDNVAISTDSSRGSSYVNSTIAATGAQYVQSVEDGQLTTYDEDGNAVKTPLATTVATVDQDATDDVLQVYSYLKAMGSTDSAIFGHQDDTFQKAGSSELSDSDTYDVTGSYAGIWGIDALALAGQEYSASQYNNRANKTQTVPDTKAGNVQAAALLTNEAIDNGSIVTLSAHMPNFSKVTTGNYDGTHSYTKYNFTGYTVNDLTGDVMNNLLPGGDYNDMFNAYLDMIADYASQVDGAILFRPFHENTGGWFWWGTSCCDPETYKSVYRYTVEYLRDTKGVHNMLYEYGPSSDATSVSEYETRYPGDEYVDIVGTDIYNQDPKDDDTFVTALTAQLNVVQEFASEHNKLMAVTETGMATSGADSGDNQTAMHRTGNKDKDWWNKVAEAVQASDASYFLLWANFSEADGFYTPYVKSVNDDGTLYGQELLDYFIDYYNDARSVFTSNMKTALQQMSSVDISTVAVSDAVSGYITSPVSGSRILEATTVKAKLSNVSDTDTVEFAFYGADDVVKTITATSTDGSTYSAQLDADTLAALGEQVGTMSLIVNGETIQTINATYNIPEPVVDPLVVDTFEDYYGVESLLDKAWTTQKGSDCSVDFALTNEAGTYNSETGSYGLAIDYSMTSGGYAGATIMKEASWSGCNALQLWAIPDGNHQKVVVQVTANSKVYEVYLNDYEEYANATGPVLITIPFSEFCERDTAGNPKGGLTSDAYAISSVGLWTNALDDTDAMADGEVSGTLYYDDVKAVTSSSSEMVFEDASVETPSTTETVTTSEAPVTSETVVTSEAPATSETVVTSEAPVTSETVVTSEAPVSSEPAVSSEVPVTSETVATSEAPSDANIEASVTTNIGGTISQTYSIAPAAGETIDLSKVTIRYNYTKDDTSAQSFWCDNAGISMSEAPYYVNYSSNVVGTFGDGYLDITFSGDQTIKDGKLVMQCRFNNSDWSSYTNFKGGSVQIYYDGALVGTY